jgi:hypothetical protein
MCFSVEALTHVIHPTVLPLEQVQEKHKLEQMEQTLIPGGKQTPCQTVD